MICDHNNALGNAALINYPGFHLIDGWFEANFGNTQLQRSH